MLQLHNRTMASQYLPMPTAAPGAPAISEWVGFKWLMGLQGHRVDVGRLQCDAAYARACLAEACACADPALRGYAQRLQSRLD